MRIGLWGASLAIFGLLGVYAVSSSRAQSGGDPGGGAPAGGMSLPQRSRTPFQPYAAGPGALSYESLSTTPIPPLTEEELAAESIDSARYRIISNETRASVDDAQAWAEGHNGHGVSAKWSRYSAKRRARAKVKAAEYEAGMAGMGDTGVE